MANLLRITYSDITKILLMLAISLSWNLLTLRNLLEAKFGLIDDHELVQFLGRDRELSLSETFGLMVNSTEVGEWGESKRFRPTYYFFRLLQTVTFGNSAGNFYLYRILIMSITATLVGVLAACLAKSFKAKISLVMLLFWTLLTSLLPVWADVVTRLGPSELEQSIFYTSFMILTWFAVSRPENSTYWISALVVVVISAGLKENMAIAFVVTLLGMSFSRARLTSKKLLTSAAILSGILVALIELGPVIAIQRGNGTDIYAQNRGLTEILQLLAQGIVSPHISVCVIFCFAVLYANRKGKLKVPREIEFLILGLLLVLISEYVFYEGNVRGNRYSMITQITLLIFLIIGTFLIKELFARSKKMKQGFFMTEAIVVILSFSILFSPAFATKNSLNIYASAESTKKQSNMFQKNLEKIVKLAQKEKNIKFVVQSSWDYEPIYSTIIYLDNYTTNSNFTLEVMAQQENTALGSMLINQLRNMAQSGKKDWKIVPRSNYSDEQQFTCVFFDVIANIAPDCVSNQVIITH
jgi:hypothetical protein